MPQTEITVFKWKLFNRRSAWGPVHPFNQSHWQTQATRKDLQSALVTMARQLLFALLVLGLASLACAQYRPHLDADILPKVWWFDASAPG